MSDETAFLDALRADPNDTTTRLVYAGWLDERGEATRAEFLRVTVRTAGTTVTDEERSRRERLRQLAAGLDTAWLAAATGSRVATVEVNLPFADAVKVSLDCCVCRRCHRTVIYRNDGADGGRTPTNHAFLGYALRNDELPAGPVRVPYLVAYRYEPFDDAKHAGRKPSGRPTWGRVSFTIDCPACGKRGSHSVQTNTVRP
jgi:uncharacterized protein (TIGR02996 family)